MLLPWRWFDFFLLLLCGSFDLSLRNRGLRLGFCACNRSSSSFGSDRRVTRNIISADLDVVDQVVAKVHGGRKILGALHYSINDEANMVCSGSYVDNSLQNSRLAFTLSELATIFMTYE